MKRTLHACLVDEETNTIHVMGGYNDNNGILKSTETWTFGTDLWVSGGNLPEAVAFSAAAKSNSNDILGFLVGGRTENGRTERTDGFTSKVWHLRRQDKRWIEDSSKTLKTPRYWHTAVNIPGNQIPGC